MGPRDDRGGQAIVLACIRSNRPGPFQIQAAIQAVHCDADSFEATDGAQIVTLYDQLLEVMPTPVVALNRAIALGEVAGPAEMLTTLEGLVPELRGYHLLHAARGAALDRLSRHEDARIACRQAADLSPSEASRRFLGSRAASDGGDEAADRG